jgi:predicted MPP superfamily phosphohydrolase
MKVRWLHISDFHFRGGDPYDSDVVLGALVSSVEKFRKSGRRPDLIFATGDIADRGQDEEYAVATRFFNALLAAADIKKERLFIIPGNHDVDRELGYSLLRTLDSNEAAQKYFKPKVPKPHISQKQRAFCNWYGEYFSGIRSFQTDSTCGSVESVTIGDFKVGILPINSALFCQDDNDHGKLWIGRRCIDAALAELDDLKTDVNIALVHHPLQWLNDDESGYIRATLATKVDLVLRGHLHETELETVDGTSGKSVNLAAGAAYQTSKWPISSKVVRYNVRKIRCQRF